MDKTLKIIVILGCIASVLTIVVVLLFLTRLGSLLSQPEWDATVKVLDAYSEGEHEHYYRYALSIYHRSKATLYDVKIYMPNGELLGHYPQIAPYDHVYYDDVHYQPEYVQITYYNGTANGTAKVNVVREES